METEASNASGSNIGIAMTSRPSAASVKNPKIDKKATSGSWTSRFERPSLPSIHNDHSANSQAGQVNHGNTSRKYRCS